jgi:hypothetical protein
LTRIGVSPAHARPDHASSPKTRNLKTRNLKTRNLKTRSARFRRPAKHPFNLRRHNRRAGKLSSLRSSSP